MEVTFTLNTAEKLSEAPVRASKTDSKELIVEAREKDEHFVMVTWAEDCIEVSSL